MPRITIDQAFKHAVQIHQAGRLAEAEGIYRQILAQIPNHAESLHLLGVLASQTNRPDLAIELISRAIELNPNSAEYHCNLGEIYRRAGNVDRAIEHGRRATSLKPQYAPAHCNLGVALRDKGLLEESISAHRRAIQVNPQYALAHKNLGNSLQDQGNLAEAIAAYRRGLAIDPNDSEANRNLGVALNASGKKTDAANAFRRAVDPKPEWLEATLDLASVLNDLHHYEETITLLTRAISFHPRCADFHATIGTALAELGRTDEAIASFRKAIEENPSHAKAYRNLGVILTHRSELDEAKALLQKAIEIDPEYANAHSSLAVVLAGSGDLDGAITEFRRAVELAPENPRFHSNLVYLFQFHPDYDSAAILAECRQWSAKHEAPVASLRGESHPNDPTPNRRLRIGYLSADFSAHVVGRNILPLLQNHNRNDFEIFCYCNSWRGDDFTRKFIAAADNWRQIESLDDAKVCEMIRADGIDILVDLSLHLRDSRLPVFARKPAPVQATFAGYPGTTGLHAIDYRLTDPFLDPPNESDNFYSEKSIRLPHSFWCYDPIAMHPADELPVAPLPAIINQYVTFGCLNNFRKVNRRVLEAWSKILGVVPKSRLILLAPAGEARKQVLDYLDPARVEFVDRMDRTEYLKTYDRIDLGLDTFPYNGHTTSLDSLWMGVPVVTLVGQTVVGRAGWSQLRNLDLRELAAQTPEQFVSIATDLAGDLPRLSELRQTLRDRMKRSPLSDAAGFTQDVQAAYRTMWKTWCKTRNPKPE